MAKIPNKTILDFNGGIRQDKSDYAKRDNEVTTLINFDIDRQGKLKKRRGGHQFGTDITTNAFIDNSVYWESWSGSGTRFHLVNNLNTNGSNTIFKIIGSKLNGAITTSTTTIAVDDGTVFANGGKVEIEGDIITYSGVTGNNLTGVTAATIEVGHPDDAAVHQTVALTGTHPSASNGIYYATLNNVLFCQGGAGASTFDGTTLTAVGDVDEPNALFATTYRQQIFCAATGGDGTLLYWSAPGGDPTAWVATDNIRIEDSIGGPITGLHVTPSDELLVFKLSSVFAHNEITTKQRHTSVGAYNHRTIQQINGLIYFFGPKGVYVTNGSSFKKISEPVEQYVKDFAPEFNLTKRIVKNTFATTFDDKYYLYINSVTNPQTSSNVLLVYDPKRNNWTTYEMSVDINHLMGSPQFLYGGNIAGIQGTEGLFAGDGANRYFRLFSKKYTDSNSNLVNATDGDLAEDFLSDTGSPVDAQMETRLNDLGSPNLKTVKYLRVLSEDKGFSISFRTEGERDIGDWIPLGEVKKRNQRFRMPSDNKGYRYAIKVAHSDSNIIPTLNGIVFEDIEVLPDNR